jgi:phosphocarrier protein
VQEATLTIINRLGLHARAAAKLVNLAKTFSSEITLSKVAQRKSAQSMGADQVDGKSIMSVMLLAAPVGTDIELRVEGTDEAEALLAICALINNRFGEEE